MIILIGEDSTETMSTSLYEYLSQKTEAVEYVLQDTIPFYNKLTFSPQNGKLIGTFKLNGKEIDFSEIKAIYTRVGSAKIPEIVSEEIKLEIDAERSIFLSTFLEYIDAMVVNTPRAQITNSSKIFQSWIIRKYGFSIPDSVVSNDENRVRAFIKKHEKEGVIFKSVSAERSEVRELNKSDMDKLSLVKYCPDLFQQKVAGTDIRVHTLATGETFACKISSEQDDYRYDCNRNIVPIDIPDKVKEACVKVTLDLGLYLSGIDLRVTPNGEYYCFEVNPSPAFIWYEEQTGLPITKALGDMMLNADKYRHLVKRKY